MPHTIRSAILAAARHIAAHPELHSFRVCRVPALDACGCPLGRIAYYRGVAPGEVLEADAAVGRDELAFYHSLSATGHPSWLVNAASAVDALRTYADTHHPDDEEH